MELRLLIILLVMACQTVLHMDLQRHKNLVVPRRMIAMTAVVVVILVVAAANAAVAFANYSNVFSAVSCAMQV